MVGWDVDANDWRSEEPDAVVENLMAEVRGGSIVLLHDGPQMPLARVAAILDGLLPRLAAQELECVTVSELLRDRLNGSTAGVESAPRS